MLKCIFSKKYFFCMCIDFSLIWDNTNLTMPGEEDEAVQATVDDIMDKTSGAESGEQPIQETNSTTIKQPQMMLTQKVQQKQQVDAVRQLNKNGLDSSLPAFKPSSVGSGGRRSTSADSERSLRLEIAESSGGGTSGAESSPLATPLVEDNGGATPTMSDCKASNAIATDSQQNVDDKTPVANITANIEKKANVGELPILKDDVIHKQDPNPTADICLNSSADDSNDPMEDAGIISCSSSSLVSSALPTTQTKGTDADVVTQSIAVPLVTSGVITTSSLSLTTPSAIAAQLAIPTATLASSCSGANSTIVTVSIAGKSAASITAAAAAAAVARSGANAGNSTTGAAPAPPTLALMRAPIQPTPVTRILPRPPTKKTQQSIVVTATSANSSTSSSTTATTSTIAPVCGTTMAIATKQGGSKSVASGGAAFVRAQQLTSGSATVFNGAKTTTIATVQKSGAGVFANGTVSSATTKFAAVAPQRVGATGGVSCVAPLTPLDGVVSAKELPMDLYNLAGSSSSCNNSYTITTSTTEMSASSMDKFNDTVNRVAAGTEISPPHPSTQLQQQMLVVTQTSATSMASSAALTPTITTASSTLTTATTAKGLVTASAGQLQHGGAEKGPQLQVLKPKPPKKKKAPAALKMKNVTTNGTDGSVDDTEQRNTTISIVDMQQQQQSSSTAPLFPVCSAVSATAPPGSGMLFPPNFALTATPNGTVGASLMTAYPNGGPGGGITQYFIRQTTSSGHQLIPVISSQQQFFFSPMPPASAEAVDSNNVTPNAQSATTLSFQGQTTEDQQQRMVIQQHQQQQVRNLYFRSGNEILMPAMVSNNVAGGANVNLSPPVAPSSQHSVVHPSFVASIQHRPSPAQPQQKGTFVGIQPKGMATAVAARTPIAPKGGNQPTGEASTAGSSSNHQSVSTPVVMIGGHPSYQQLSTAPSQQQYFLTSSGAIVTLQAPPHHFQQPQQHLSTLSNVRVLPSANSNPSAFAITSADTEQYMQKNGMVGSTPNSSRSAAANSLTAKVSSPKRKRKMDTKNAVVNTTVTTTTIPVDIDPTKYLSHHQMTEDPSTVDEEENEPPPVLCRVFNRSDDEPVVSTQSMESLFQREAKIIRERMFDGNGKKFGPLKHFIDGFEIEEDIEPFPCEHQQLLDKLKRDQAGLEAEIGGDMQKETDATKSGTVSPEKTAEIAVENAVRRKGHKRTASVLSPGSSPTSSPKKSNTMETDTYERMEVNNSHSTEEDSCAVAIDASGTSEEKANHQQRQLSADEHAAAAADDSATDLASVVKKGRRRELDGLLKMDFGKHSPFQTSDPDKYAKEVLIEARQQQRTLALAQEEQRNARRSVESSAGGSTTGKSSKRDKHAKKPFSPPVSPLPESRSASVHSTTPTVTSKGKNQGEKAYSSSSVSSKLAKASGGGQTTKEGNNNSAALVMENKLKISPKDSFSLEQRRSCGSNVSEEGEERCLYCRRSFKEVSRDKDHVQYCSKSCRKQLKAAKRMKHSGGSLDEGMNSSIGMAGDEPRNGVATATPLHRRSDPSSSSDSSGQQQQSACHITSPLGSAFSAMQPQMLSKRRLPVDQHAEQLMSLNQRLSGNNGSGLAPPFVPPPYGQSPTTDQTQAMLAVPMAIRPTSGGPQTMIQYGTPTAMYFNAATHHQMVVSSSNSTADQQQQAAAAVHAYQQQQQQQHHHEQHMLYATPGTVAGGPQQQQQHFFPPAGPSGVHPGTPTQFLPPPMARQQSFSTAPSSSPATPVPTPTSFMERNVEIDALVTRGVHTWTKEEVCKWVNFVTGSDTNGDRFVDEDVDGTSLLCLNQEQLKTELKFKLGPAIKLWSALEVLKRNMMC